MPVVSIIVPIFNQETYLRECLESISSQSFSDFEVVLVDDGSTDSTISICKIYTEKDSRFKLIKKNHVGVSAARNSGIEAATGDFITFVDSDDKIKPDFLNILIGMSHNSDFVMTGHQEFGVWEGVYSMPEDLELALDSLSGRIVDVGSNCLSWNINFLFCWAKLYKRSIIIDHNICFEESLSLGEDTLFVLNYLAFSKNIFAVSGAYYLYRRSGGNFWMKYVMDLSKTRQHLSALSNGVRQFESGVGCSLPNLYAKNVNVYVNCFRQHLYSISNFRDFRRNVNDFFRHDYPCVMNSLSPDKVVFFENCKKHTFLTFCCIHARIFYRKIRTTICDRLIN